ncbi:heparan-alpha-glucosaminide N-acetyltransferase domain-containing protein [Microbacterium maritypicum]|uniref:heparan-alpha-glucosaminide N-acetyltransferase domain-containing protein n=1 Tax=Microbacterium TaxID=33882 RepID=UPI00142221A4|nr:heparan-alpha-glucosaminide N-acetyltransferase domain-containing protein [Microbacterium sp. Be9]
MGRLLVPDALRGFAIVAMLIAHAAPFVPNAPWAVQFITANFSSVASPLFALVMGMSAELVWRRGGPVGVTLLQQTLRGLFLIVLGVWMATWGSGWRSSSATLDCSSSSARPFYSCAAQS